MKKLIVFGLIVTVLFAGGIAFFMKPSHDMGSSTNNQKQPVNSDPNAVSIQGFSFKLADKVIKKGTTITWTNMDDAHHDVTPTSGASDFVASKLMGKGETYSFTFNSVGKYTYKCSPHPYMKGTIEVTE